MNESFCADCTILSTKFTLTYQNGTAVKNSDEIYLSALLTKDLQKSGADYISPCPANSPKRVFFAGGATFVSLEPDALEQNLMIFVDRCFK
jgi:hypothetical protein